MKYIVLLAPGAVAPWTEGRRVFVRDLCIALRDQGLSVAVIAGNVGSSPLTMLLSALRELRERCASSKPPDGVAVFPYGTFQGVRGWLNGQFLERARALCARFGVPQLPVFYSAVGPNIDQLGMRFGPALAVGRAAPNVLAMPLGVGRIPHVWHPPARPLQRLLFLCGYQASTAYAMRDVLLVRGLDDLLTAGNAIASAGLRLTIAIPFLREAGMRRRLLEHAQRKCPELHLDLLDEVATYPLFLEHDVFVFPYRTEHSVFTPTSLLEALSIGIPTIAADRLMYQDLTKGLSGPRCTLYDTGAFGGLEGAIRAVQRDYPAAVALAHAARSEVRQHWSIERSAEVLLRAFKSVVKAGVVGRA